MNDPTPEVVPDAEGPGPGGGDAAESVDDGAVEAAELHVDVDPADAALVESGMQRLREGKRPSVEENRSIKRYRKARDEALREQHYRTVPIKMVRAWSGRNYESLKRLENDHGIPIIGQGTGVMNLPKMLAALTDFFARNGHLLAGMKRDGAGGTLSAQIKAADLENKMMRNAERRGTLVRRDVVQRSLAGFMAHVRRAGERIEANFGPGAAAPLQEARELVRAEFTREFAAEIPLLPEAKREPEPCL